MCQKRGPWIYKRVLWHQNPGLRVAVLQQEKPGESLIVHSCGGSAQGCCQESLPPLQTFIYGVKSVRNLIPSLQGHIHHLFTQTYLYF